MIPAYYLASEQWLALARLARRRAGHCCELCRAPQIDVYPRPGVSWRALQGATVDDLQVLCSSCHRMTQLRAAVVEFLRGFVCH